MHRFIPLLLTVSVLGCAPVEAPTEDAASAGKPVVYAVNYPLAWMAFAIGGDTIDLRFPAPEDVDPAYWQPDRDTLAAMQGADLILLNGADYAKWVKTASLPESVLVNTSEAFAGEYLVMADAVQHSHGPEGMHAHEGVDFNTWLDPVLAAQQAEAVCEALCAMAPEYEARYREAAAPVDALLKGLDGKLRSWSDAHPDLPLVASHPVYGYLAKRYGWNLVSMHWEPGEMPSDAEWDALKTLLETHPARTMIWEGRPDPAIADRVKSLGMRVAVFHPCGNLPPDGDYLQTMEENIRRLMGR